VYKKEANVLLPRVKPRDIPIINYIQKFVASNYNYSIVVFTNELTLDVNSLTGDVVSGNVLRRGNDCYGVELWL